MTDPRTCSRCGAPLSAIGECPRCLLRLGLQLPPRDASGSRPPTTAAAPPQRPVALPLEEVARRFPQLEIKSLLGQGGMGVVYLARQPRLGRDVALKLLPPEQSSDPAFAERFLREARAMARLSHPNIVAVHDFGESDGLCWLLMDYVDGVNLRAALRAGALPPEKALAIVPQMCDALQYAHDEGVVHRDIKPENVLLDRQGRVKLADFGLAKLMGPQDVTLTGEHQVFGTPHYMAPEQMEAACDVDHRADIFSLGVVFYEMLTGKLPVGRFAPPSRHVSVDVRLDDVVLHALEHEASRRYQHVVEVKTDVASVVAGREPEAAHAANAEHANAAHAAGTQHAANTVVGPAQSGARAGGARPEARSKPQDEGAAVPGRRRGWGWVRNPRVAWTVVAMVLWTTLAWRIAGELALRGRPGAAAGIAMLSLTAWLSVLVLVRTWPELGAVCESADKFWLRQLLAASAIVGGVLLMGQGQIESWEHGTDHYISDSRSWEAMLAPAPVNTEALLTSLDGVARGSVERVVDSPWQGTGSLDRAGGAFIGGALLLFLSSAALVIGVRGWRSQVAPLLLVPLLLFAGLKLASLWSELAHQAEEWPDLQVVSGTARMNIGVMTADMVLQHALENDGYVVHAGLSARIESQGSEVARELDVALEPEAPWDRWSLEGGLPRRRRPHVLLRLMGDKSHCAISWDCGYVRPLAGEPDAWRGWMESILHPAR